MVDMEMEVITYNMLKQFLWRHMERHGINNLEQREESFIRIHVGAQSRLFAC